jgi:hypothetical protein
MMGNKNAQKIKPQVQDGTDHEVWPTFVLEYDAWFCRDCHGLVVQEDGGWVHDGS